MPTPTYTDAYAPRLQSAIIEITEKYAQLLGLEPEVSWGTLLRGKQYGVLMIASEQENTGGRIGSPGGYNEQEIFFNFRYTTVVASQGGPGNDVSSSAILNGQAAFNLLTFSGAIDQLNAIVTGGRGVSEIRVLERTTNISQQTKDPRDYEVSVLGRLSLVYHVRRDFDGVPVSFVEPANG